MFGKLLGAILGLFFLRSITGAIIGALFGHFFFDRAVRARSGSSSQYGGFSVGSSSMFNRQDTFFQLFFCLLGKMAKIDGTLSQEEHIYVSNLFDKMNLRGPARNMAQDYFHQAQHNPQSYQDISKQFYQITSQQPELRKQLLYQLVGIASADKLISEKERTFLEEITEILKIPMSELEHYIKSFGAEDDRSYHILGVSPSDSDEEIKKSYKKRLKEYHPDVLKSKGLPPSMLEFAEKRFLDIQNAWNQIKLSRKIND